MAFHKAIEDEVAINNKRVCMSPTSCYYACTPCVCPAASHRYVLLQYWCELACRSCCHFAFVGPAPLTRPFASVGRMGTTRLARVCRAPIAAL
eukprot:7129288-Pyramimonas_sp.AAC.1